MREARRVAGQARVSLLAASQGCAGGSCPTTRRPVDRRGPRSPRTSSRPLSCPRHSCRGHGAIVAEVIVRHHAFLTPGQKGLERLTFRPFRDDAGGVMPSVESTLRGVSSTADGRWRREACSWRERQHRPELVGVPESVRVPAHPDAVRDVADEERHFALASSVGPSGLRRRRAAPAAHRTPAAGGGGRARRCTSVPTARVARRRQLGRPLDEVARDLAAIALSGR